MKLSDIAQLIQGELKGADVTGSFFNINTRELNPGEIFIALKGEQFDGHDFLQSAWEKKAVGAIVSQPVETLLPTITVKNTRLALGELAKHHRKTFKLPVIAVTGSCGKTTTKSMIASILSQMGPTLAPIKSYNNEIGVPLTLLQLNETHQYAVIEMGANHHHEIAYLSEIAQQNIAMITNVAPAHLEGFGSIEGVAKAKSEIYSALGPDGIGVLNIDDPFSKTWQPLLKGKVVLTFGSGTTADVYAKHIELDEEGYPHFEVHYPQGVIKVSLPLLGHHNVMNALAAIAATYAAGACVEAMEKGLKSVHPVNNRLVKYKGLNGALVIDDTYNANPLSVKAALEMLHHSRGEKIFVFGDMAELGGQSDTFHAEVGKQAKSLGIHQLLAYGPSSYLTVNAFGDQGKHFDDQANLIEALKSSLHPHATVLIKGSRSSKMENIVKAIT